MLEERLTKECGLSLRRWRHWKDVMHERPQKLLAETLVVLILQLRAQEHGHAVEALGDVRGDGLLLEQLNLRAQTAEEEYLLRGCAAQDARGRLTVD